MFKTESQPLRITSITGHGFRRSRFSKPTFLPFEVVHEHCRLFTTHVPKHHICCVFFGQWESVYWRGRLSLHSQVACSARDQGPLLPAGTFSGEARKLGVAGSLEKRKHTILPKSSKTKQGLGKGMETCHASLSAFGEWIYTESLCCQTFERTRKNA